MEDYTTVISDGERIPQLLRDAKRWCFWQLEPNQGGRPTKRPDQSTRDLNACRSWPEVKGRQRWSGGGIGFVTSQGLNLKTGTVLARILWIDLDACRDPKTEVIEAWAVAVMQLCGNSYCEVSPSGAGLRIVVAVRNVAADIHLTVNVPHPAPPGVDKKPAIQLFGTGPAGYVTMTGERIASSNPGIAVIDNLDQLIEKFRMRRTKQANDGIEKLTGVGPVPSLDEITAGVLANGYGKELIEGDWRKATPDKSASEAFFVLVQFALAAARGHGEQAVQWLLQRTAWGRGDVDDSADSGKYTHEQWVQKEVVRAAQKTPRVRVDQEFPSLPPLPAGEEPKQEPEKKGSNGSPLDVIDQMGLEGPLVRLPTGIESLDAMTGGGLVLGSRVYNIGAPDAGKTLLTAQIIDHYLAQGIAVAILGVDEEPPDILMRLMQRRGLSRTDIEARSPATLARMRELLSKLPLLLFDGETTIERAAKTLHRYACSRSPGVDKPPCVLMIDSVQTARCEQDDGNDSLYKQVTHRVRMIRAASAKFRMLVLATSEMSRAAYRSRRVDDQARDMAAAKESGAIEFSARVLLSLRNVPGVADVVELRVVKNKHGASHRDDQDGIFLRVDRDRQHMTEDQGFEPLADEDEQKQVLDERRLRDAARLVVLLTERDVGRNEAAKELKLSNRRLDEVVGWLEEVKAVTKTPGAGRRLMLKLEPDRVPDEVWQVVNSLL